MPEEIRKDQMKLDANESAFFTRQLEFVKRKTYDVKYKNLKATSLIPVSTEAPVGADSITFRSFTKVGIAKVVSDYANDFPRVDVYGTESSVKVHSLGNSYGYSIKEIRRSQMAGTNLESRRANTARRAMDELLDDIAWNGKTANNIQGLIDYPGITEYTLPNDGTGTTKTWSTKTPDQIIRDVSGLTNAVTTTTNGREIPDTCILPLKQYNQISTTRVTGGDTNTVLKFIMDTNPYLDTIEWVQELSGAGAGGLDRIMVYAKDPDHLTLEIPQAFEQFAPQWKGMTAEIPCHMETAGVIVYYPLSIAFADGL